MRKLCNRRSASQLAAFTGLGLVVLLTGCAKLPDSGLIPQSRRLVFTMTVQGEINRNYVYIVALRPSADPNPPEQGPIPVVAPPWGNGFVAGNVTHFVRWDPLQSPNYLIYQFRNQSLIEYFATGVPINYVDVQQGAKAIRFEIDLNQIAANQQVAESFQSLQVNFLSMDRVPQGDTGSKTWDGLGDSGLPLGVNQWVTIPLRTTGTYDNRRFNDLEPVNDTAIPDLDISNWSVEVRAQ
ncbi:MAG TPA: hypothetical protein VEX38_07720 [Fimbriimonadaceae bacterium]|nr:hypothetical protein [Fimbriimonadaceae bacterium]